VNVRGEEVSLTLPSEYAEQSLVDVMTDASVRGPELTLEPYGYHLLRVGE